MRDFEDVNSQNTNTQNKNDNSSSDHYPESVVLKYPAEQTMICPGLVWQKIQEPLTQGTHFLGVVGVNTFLICIYLFVTCVGA